MGDRRSKGTLVKPGDRVVTPAGEGTVLTLRKRMVWTGLYREARGFIAVDLGHEVRVFPAQLVKPKLEVV